MRVAIDVTEDGLVTVFPYHDGRLQRIEFLESGGVNLAISSCENIVTTIMLHSIKYFIANELREGNIVADIWLWKMIEAPRSPYTEALEKLGVKVGADLPANELDRMYLFSLTCSYGCDIFAIVESPPHFFNKLD